MTTRTSADETEGHRRQGTSGASETRGGAGARFLENSTKRPGAMAAVRTCFAVLALRVRGSRYQIGKLSETYGDAPKQSASLRAKVRRDEEKDGGWAGRDRSEETTGGERGRSRATLDIDAPVPRRPRSLRPCAPPLAWRLMRHGAEPDRMPDMFRHACCVGTYQVHCWRSTVAST